MIKTVHDFHDYQLLDCGHKEKLETWKNITLRRPDPTAIWQPSFEKLWKKVDGHYHRSNKGGGKWDFYKKLPDFWTIQYRHLTFKVSPTDFKHTGLFPEQAVNWNWMSDVIKKSKRKDIKVLNLFAYTGGATLACSSAGAAEVVHVDAAKHMVSWAKENAQLSNLTHNKIRFIVDDCLKFVQREARRGNKYDAIIMDPPSYGRGPNKELWKIEDHLIPLIEACMDILVDEPLFFLINSYTTTFSPQTIQNVLTSTLLQKYPKGTLDVSEIGIPVQNSTLILPCGVSGRYEHTDTL